LQVYLVLIDLTTFVEYLIPVLALTLLVAGWMGMQLLAKKMKVKNHIDHRGGCCGACSGDDDCRGKKT
jgi:hypothetical protein